MSGGSTSRTCSRELAILHLRRFMIGKSGDFWTAARPRVLALEPFIFKWNHLNAGILRSGEERGATRHDYRQMRATIPGRKRKSSHDSI
ncbi:MAG: hypothetical protein K8H74_08865 [Notoacmeibacter sp.]|nr:hypothetical protein [Notoacmeibacter sp.]